MFQVVYKKTGEILALKAVKKGVMSREQATRTMTERSIMARVRSRTDKEFGLFASECVVVEYIQRGVA